MIAIKSVDKSKSILNQPHYKNGIFQNLSPTTMKADDISYFKMIADSFKKPKGVKPDFVLPSIHTDLKNLDSISATKPVVIWFGHSSYLIHCNRVNILVDPVFCGYASPFPFMIKSFKSTLLFLTFFSSIFPECQSGEKPSVIF